MPGVFFPLHIIHKVCTENITDISKFRFKFINRFGIPKMRSYMVPCYFELKHVKIIFQKRFTRKITHVLCKSFLM